MGLGLRKRSTKIALGATGLGTVALVGGCLVGAAGIVPPTKQIYFPTALAVSPGRSTLYLANSDFDLQYNGGTVQAFGLSGVGGLRSVARTVASQIASGAGQAAVCEAIGAKPNDQAFLDPGPCTALAVNPFIVRSATIGAFASAATILTRSDGQPGARLFVAVRGDPSVTYFDIDDDRDPANPVKPCNEPTCLECAGSGTVNRCATSHLIGTDPFANPRELILPTEPAGVDGIALPVASGDTLVVPQETTASASLVVNRWPNTSATGPTLEYVLPNLNASPISVTAIPMPLLALVASESTGYQPGFIISHQAAANLTVVRYSSDELSRPARPFISLETTIPITFSNMATDQRGIAIDATDRRACEAACPATSVICAANCLTIPLGLFVASRSPAALLLGKIETTAVVTGSTVTGMHDTFTLSDSFPLPTGPSLVRMGQIVNDQGAFEPRVFVVSFDARYVYSFDPKNRDIDVRIKTGRGPFGLGIDAGRTDDGTDNEAFLYVGHFTDSYLGVVDLDERHTATFGTFLVNVGPPVEPREDQSP